MSLKAQVEALIYAAEEPITLEQLAVLLKDAVLAEMAAEREQEAGAQPGATSCESTLLPELDGGWEELNGLEPGPLMPQLELEPAESPAEQDSLWEDDEPLFAMQAEALSEFSLEDLAEPSAAWCEAAPSEPAPENSAGVAAAESSARKRQPRKSEKEIAEDKAVRARLREALIELMADYASEERGMEIRQVAGGYRMTTKPQHHDLVRGFAKSLKPPMRLSLAALETLAVIAYKQPVTAPEIAEIRGVESAGVLGTLLDRKLITTAGRKQVIGRPMQYKTSRDFLLRFGLNDLSELPSMEEFSQLALDVAIEGTVLETPAADTPQAAEAENAASEISSSEAHSASATGDASEGGNSADQ
jgi:segregation and condensation protein B